MKMKLDPLLKSIIQMKNIDRFSITEARTAYIVLAKDETLDKAKLRQFIYDELNRLVKKGWLTKTTSDNGKESRFKKTDNFAPSLLLELPKRSENEPNNGRKLQSSTKHNLSILNADLLECMGALDTFIDMKRQYPEMSGVLNEVIRSSKEQKHILKGKIAATEEIIELLKEKTE